MNKLLYLAIAGLLLYFAAAAHAQSPYPNISGTDAQASVRNAPATANILTAQGPGTVNGAAFAAFGRNVSCIYFQTAHTGTPSGGSFSVQGQVPGSNPAVWYTVATAAVPTVTDGNTILNVGPVFTTTNQVPPQTIRAVLVEAGGGSTVTGGFSCGMSD